MNWKLVSQILIFELIAIAAIVAIGIQQGRDMWSWIISYWIVLTMKNLADWICSFCAERKK